MADQGYSLGRDVAIDIITASGPLRLPKVTKFSSKPKFANQEITTLDGNTDELLTPKGWEGDIDIERTDGTADNYQSQWEDNYFNGVSNGTITITETITETGGSTSVYRYEGVVLRLENAGTKQGEKTITQSFKFTARRRKKVG